MKINPSSAGMPALDRGPSLGGIASPQVDRIFERAMEVERAPVDAAKQTRAKVDAVRTEVNAFAGMLQELGSATDGLRMPSAFNKMRAESSNPEILESAVTGAVREGIYTFEVEGLATPDKHLAMGFPDADQTEVGFGHIGVALGDGKMQDVTVNPGATLRDVAEAINASAAGVHAKVINTGLGDDPFRLHVVSETSGEEARVALDPDTTFLDFQNSTTAKNLNMKFDDVAVARPGNDIKDLVDGLAFNAKRAEPGTQVTVSVKPDVEATFAGIGDFIGKYNKVAAYGNQQFKLTPRGDSQNPSMGPLADGTTRQVMRSLQSQMSSPIVSDGPFHSLADIGITTNAKTGELVMDEAKVKQALAGNYDGVRSLFASSENGVGVAERLSNAVKTLNSSASGSVSLRQATLNKQIQSQDRNIENKVRQMEAKGEQVKKSLNAMQSQMARLEGQQAFISARGDGSGAAGG